MQLHDPHRTRDPANKLLGRPTIFEGLIFYRFPLSLPPVLPLKVPVYIRPSGRVIGQARKIDSDISHVPPLISTGVKSAKFGLSFQPESSRL